MQTKLLIYIIIGILVVAGVAGASWYFVTRQPAPAPPIEKVPPPVVQPPPETPPEEVPTNETANLKTYGNEKYGFEFKYPKDWVAIESVSPEYPYLVFVTLGPQETVQQGGFFAVAIRDQTEDEYLSSLTQEGFYVIGRTDTTLGGKKATIYTFGRAGSPGIQWKEVIAQKEDFLLQFSKGATRDYEDIFNQILSTFRFSP